MKFAVTPRQRWELAMLFLHKDLVLTTLEQKKAFNRTRRALRLNAPMALMTRKQWQANEALCLDEKTLQSVDLEEAHRDFLMSRIFTLQSSGNNAAALESLMNDVESAKLSGSEPVLDASILPVPDIEQWDNELVEADTE